MKIVITGATGYIGMNLLKRLNIEEYDVYIIVREHSDISTISKYISNEKILNILTNTELLYNTMMTIKPDILIHLAGIFISDHSKQNISELLTSNIKDSSIILDAAYEAGCKKIINTGSYWQNYNNEKYNPVNLYAATKEAFERIVDYYTKACGCRAITLKLFDTYGRYDTRNKLLNTLNNLNEDDEIDVTYGEQFVYFCYIEDVVEAYVKAIILINNIKQGNHEVYDVRSVERIKLKEIIRLYTDIAEKKIKINFGKRPYRRREFMNPTGYNKILKGWTTKYTLVDGLKKFVKK